jgi:hypothetical protein
MDIQISSGFRFGATSMPMKFLWTGQSEADGFGHGSGFPISVQTRSIAILNDKIYKALRIEIIANIIEASPKYEKS